MDAASNFISNLLQILPKFFGTKEEDPWIHLQKFENVMLELVGNNLNDHLLFKYFPFSLRDDAFFWFNYVPPASLVSWYTFQEHFIQEHMKYLQAIYEQHHKQMQLQLQQLQAQFDDMIARDAAMIEEVEATQRILEEAGSDAKKPNEHIQEPCIDDQEDEDDTDDRVMVIRIGDTIQFRAKNVHEDEESEGECTEPELSSTSDLFPQPSPSPVALPDPKDCTEIQGSFSTFSSMSESHSFIENNLDSVQNPTCNYSLPSLPIFHEFKDPYFPIISNIYMISFQGNMHMGRLRKANVHIMLRSILWRGLKRNAGVARSGIKSLAEERKEALEQLPAPLKIMDPPFEQVYIIQ